MTDIFRLDVLRRARLKALVLPLMILSLSGCKSTNIPLLTAPASTPIVTATSEPTQVPRIVETGYDRFAGNCVDAANEDVDLIDYAQSQNYNFDMQLQIAPTSGCGANKSSPAYRTFVTQVGQVTLNMNALDTQWVYGYAPTLTYNGQGQPVYQDFGQ
jgi:hypothetical protein